MKIVPCEEHEFSQKEEMFSVFLGSQMECKKCGESFVRSRMWMNFFTLIEFLMLAVAFFFVAVHKSFWILLYWVIFYFICCCLTYKFVPVKKDLCNTNKARNFLYFIIIFSVYLFIVRQYFSRVLF